MPDSLTASRAVRNLKCALGVCTPGSPSHLFLCVLQMRFNGVPERVNGRLAMMAFLYIARREMETGLTGKAGWSLRMMICLVQLCALCCRHAGILE